MTDSKLTEENALAEIISDDEISRVHGYANFGAMSPREVVNDGVRKYAVGYSGGHTQLQILLEHGLITTPRPGRYDASLTKKGKRYARALFGSLLSAARTEGRAEGSAERERLRERDKPMDLHIALDFADNPLPYDTLRCPADSKEELYEALRVLAAAYRQALEASQ